MDHLTNNSTENHRDIPKYWLEGDNICSLGTWQISHWSGGRRNWYWSQSGLHTYVDVVLVASWPSLESSPVISQRFYLAHVLPQIEAVNASLSHFFRRSIHSSSCYHCKALLVIFPSRLISKSTVTSGLFTIHHFSHIYQERGIGMIQPHMNSVSVNYDTPILGSREWLQRAIRLGTLKWLFVTTLLTTSCYCTWVHISTVWKELNCSPILGSVE